MNRSWFVTAMVMLAGACGQKATPCLEGLKVVCPGEGVYGAAVPKLAERTEALGPRTVKRVEQGVSERVIAGLIVRHGDMEKDRIARGVRQAAALWDLTRDGDEKAFEVFCLEHFRPDGDARRALFERLHRNLEILQGHAARVRQDLGGTVQPEVGELLPVDRMFTAYNPGAHVQGDLYANRIAFVTILNFPSYTLVEKKTAGPGWSRWNWAYVRLGDVFTSRVPAEVRQGVDTAFAKAGDYISNYNIYMGKVVDADGRSLFPAALKLVTHWNLRDELKSRYGDKVNGTKAQRQIHAVMKRIIDQSIPLAVVNRGELTWNPETNQLFKAGKEQVVMAEPDTRYEF